MAHSVIHKQVLKLKPNLIPEEVYYIEVPVDAGMVEIGWDSIDPLGIALWYKTSLPSTDSGGQEVKFWNFIVRDTGEVFPDTCKHQAVVIQGGIVLHVLDTEDGRVNWEQL